MNKNMFVLDVTKQLVSNLIVLPIKPNIIHADIFRNLRAMKDSTYVV